jgi:hypothetical protein
MMESVGMKGKRRKKEREGKRKEKEKGKRRKKEREGKRKEKEKGYRNGEFNLKRRYFWIHNLRSGDPGSSIHNLRSGAWIFDSQSPKWLCSASEAKGSRRFAPGAQA